jgi:hypothetical protein
METSVRTLFERYERVFNAALHGDVDMDDVAALYAAEFVAASPAGVMTGKNDEQLKQVMAQGYARYRTRRCAYGDSASRQWTNTIASRMSPGERPMPARTNPMSRLISTSTISSSSWTPSPRSSDGYRKMSRRC